MSAEELSFSPDKMPVEQARSLLRAYAAEHNLQINEYLASVARWRWLGVYRGLFKKGLAEPIVVLWDHYSRLATEKEVLGDREPVLGLYSIEIAATGELTVFLRAVVEVTFNE